MMQGRYKKSMVVLAVSVLTVSGWVYHPVRRWAKLLPYRRYAKARPTDAEAARLLATQYAISGDIDKELRTYTSFIQNNPDNFDLHKQIALIFQGKYVDEKSRCATPEPSERGIELLKEVVRYARVYVEHHPSDPDGYVTLGKALSELGDTDEGNRYLARAIELTRAHVETKAEKREKYIRSLMKGEIWKLGGGIHDK